MTANKLPSPPEELISQDGKVAFGNYEGAFDKLNLDSFDFTALRRWPWSSKPSRARKLLKRWQFVGAMDEHMVLGAAAVHLNYLGSGFAYAYDRRTGKITELNLKAPAAKGTQFSASPTDGTSQIQKGDRIIKAENTITDGMRKLTVDFGDALSGELRYREPGNGVSTASRQSMYGFHYTYKSAGLPVEGSVTVNGEEYRFSKNALALLDWTASTPPRETAWNWAAGVGMDESGTPIGINFSTGLIAAGYTQNAVWINGTPHMLVGVNFDYDQKDILGKPWRVSTVDDAVDLTFQPSLERFEDVNFGLVASSLHQPFGTFEGTIKVGGQTIKASLFGFCEEHYAKW